MLTVEPGEIFIVYSVTSCAKSPQNFGNLDNPKTKDFHVNASQFTTCTISSVTANDIYGNPGTRPGGEDDVELESDMIKLP